MKPMRCLLSALFLVCACVTAAQADAPTATPPGSNMARAGAGRDRRVYALLRALSLTPNQRAQVNAIRAQAKPRLDALVAALRTRRTALATTSPGDPSYPMLLAEAQASAAARIQLRAEVWAQLYAVLTPQQQAQLPSLVATARARHAARRAAWQASHAQT